MNQKKADKIRKESEVEFLLKNYLDQYLKN